eukprot:67649-Alexandrium_andersonii.AAC.1
MCLLSGVWQCDLRPCSPMGLGAQSGDGEECVGGRATALAQEGAAEAGSQAEQRLPQSEGVTLPGSECPGVSHLRGSPCREPGLRMRGAASESPRAKAVGGRVMGSEPLSDPRSCLAAFGHSN